MTQANQTNGAKAGPASWPEANILGPAWAAPVRPGVGRVNVLSFGTPKGPAMGNWGVGSFENDWALDWIGDLRESQDASPVRVALERVVEHGGTKYSRPSMLERLRGLSRHTDWLKARDAAQALAAAEIVSAWLGHAPAKLPDGVADWLQQHRGAFQSDLLTLAHEAVRIVKTNSELKDLWEEDGTTEWRDGVEDLERRLHN